jgi:hypothetical protein
VAIPLPTFLPANQSFFSFPFSILAGDTNVGEIPHFELFCNPNAHSTAFDAKVLVTVRSVDGVQIVMEATLEQVRAGVKDALLASREKAA